MMTTSNSPTPQTITAIIIASGRLSEDCTDAAVAESAKEQSKISSSYKMLIENVQKLKQQIHTSLPQNGNLTS